MRTLAPMCLDMKVIVFIFLLTFSISGYGQSDCVIRFTYTWTTDSSKDNEIELGLPTTSFLGGYTIESDEESFHFVKINPNHEVTLVSHMSSEFCGGYQHTIDKFFKGNKSSYLLKLRTNSKDKEQIREIKIPIDSINFSFDKTKKQIRIQLPDISH
jgi:hypothetical protein